MTLSSMVVSRDWSEVSVLECILSGLHIGVEVEPEPERARAKLAKSKIDALIVDCDLDGSTGFLKGLSQDVNTVPLVIMSSPKNWNALHQDASFIFKKPISVEQAVHTLSAARNLILDGRLRYHRHSVDFPASIRVGTKRVDAHILNLSQGGVAVHPPKTVALKGKIGVEFKLPGTNRALKTGGEIVWGRQGNYGIRFVDVSRQFSKQLHIWLAQQYLTH